MAPSPQLFSAFSESPGPAGTGLVGAATHRLANQQYAAAAPLDPYMAGQRRSLVPFQASDAGIASIPYFAGVDRVN
jgi:hypothetical protein